MDLKADGIAVERSGRLVLTAPPLHVSPGETAVITGPNGAGKSTFLRALAGLLPCRRGTITFGPYDSAADGAEYGELIAYAGHLDAIKPALSVRSNLAHWAAILGGRDDRVDAALARFDLSRIADAPAAWCSAGQKRRLGLARLMIVDRPLWILDEPTVSLDAGSVRVFAEEVARHCAGGGMAVAATHIDIGLPDGPRLSLTAPEAEEADADDPFLQGQWA
ncbi:MAG: heme ABC exporter ATP-binding protein CcmA [Pseudomonadota bacterium]